MQAPASEAEDGLEHEAADTETVFLLATGTMYRIFDEKLLCSDSLKDTAC